MARRKAAAKPRPTLSRQVRVSAVQWANLYDEARDRGLQIGRYLDLILSGLGESRRTRAALDGLEVQR